MRKLPEVWRRITKRRHRRYVGRKWDLSGAHQFQAMMFLGLREHHYMLDIGCGSFRGGRFFIMYLNQGHYFGIEPQKWLIDAGIKYEVGQDLINIKKPTFDHNEDANLSVFNRKFDYILAHSILIHAPIKWIEVCFREVKEVLKPSGIFAANIKLRAGNNVSPTNNPEGWAYPHSRAHPVKEMERLVQDAGLAMKITDIKYLGENLLTWIVVKHKDNMREILERAR